MHEAEPQMYDTHLEHDTHTSPRHGHASETCLSGASPSLVRNVCTFNSTGKGFLPRADSGYSRDLLVSTLLLLQFCSAGTSVLLLFSVTSAVEKMFYDARVCQGGDVPQILVIFGNLP